jgi:hypothetical protein
MKKSFSKSSANSGNNKGKHANKHGRKYKEEDREDRGVDVACESVFRVAINPREVGDGSEGAKEADGTAGSGEEDCEDEEDIGSSGDRTIAVKLFMWEFGQNDPKR